MRLGQSICLIAFGAALKFAVHAPSDRIDIGTIGVILMLVGILSLFLSPTDWYRPASSVIARGLGDRPTVPGPPPDPAMPAPPLPAGPPAATDRAAVPEPRDAPPAPVHTGLRVVQRPAGPAAGRSRRAS